MTETLMARSWNEYLDRFDPGSTDVYFREEYARLYERDGAEVRCFVHREGDRVLLFPVAAKRSPWLPQGKHDLATPYGYGGPIANTHEAAFVGRALSEFESLAAEEGAVSCFVRYHPLLRNDRLTHGRWENGFDRQTVAIPLDLAEAELWNEQCDRRNRNRIKKAIDYGLQFTVDESLERVDEFIDIYYRTMDAVQARNFYYFDRDYFRRLASSLRGRAVLAFVHGEMGPIAAKLCLQGRPYCHDHLSGSLPEFRAANPNNLMLYKTALYYRDRGYRLFHIGGGTSPSPDDTLFRFKRHFSKERCEFHVGRLILDEPAYRAATEAWERETDLSAEETGFFPAYAHDSEAEAVAV